MTQYKILHFDIIDSTNLYIKNNYKELDEYTVIDADTQTNGRGRLGRSWLGTKDNLYFSILVKPNKSDIAIISLLVGASIHEALKEYINTSIKWPNDLLINDKKVCGILLESVISDKVEALIIGVGINVNQLVFEEVIKNKATSLKNELGFDIEKKELLNKIIVNFDFLYQSYLNNDYSFVDIVRNNFYLTNKEVYINDVKAKVLGLDNSGELRVLINDKEILVNSNEVTLEKSYNN